MASYSANNVAIWILNECRAKNIAVSPMKLQKLLYYCQGYSLGMAATPLFDDRIEAWEHGPVVPSVYQTYKKSGNEIISSFSHTETPEDVRAIILAVLEDKGRITASGLSLATHREPPYCHTPPKQEITREAMDKYFSSLFWESDEEDEYQPSFESEEEEREYFLNRISREEHDALFAGR